VIKHPPAGGFFIDHPLLHDAIFCYTYLMEQLHVRKLEFLEEMANTIRQDVVGMLEHAGSGHSAGSLGMADIFTALYFHLAKHDPKDPHSAIPHPGNFPNINFGGYTPGT